MLVLEYLKSFLGQNGYLKYIHVHEAILHFASIFKKTYSEVEEEISSSTCQPRLHLCHPWVYSMDLVTGSGTRARGWGSVGERETGRNSLRREHNAFELDLKFLVPWWYLIVSSVSQKDINPGDKRQCSPWHRPTYLDWGGSAACRPADIHLRLYWILFFSDKALVYISNFSEDIDLIIIAKDQKREKTNLEHIIKMTSSNLSI